MNDDIDIGPWVERRAKLFEAGDYPDKGVEVTGEDLDALEASFDAPVPLLIEHADSPLALGFLKDVRREGDELFGTVSLSREANELIERSGAHALSLGLSPDLRRIVEVSLVRSPRVADARLFAGRVTFEAEFRAETDWRRRCEALEAAQCAAEAERTADRLVADGRLTPAQRPFAVALLTRSDRTVFGGEPKSVAELALGLIESGVPHGLFSELAATPSQPGSSLEPDQTEFFRRHFPDVSLEEIARRMESRA